MQEGHLMPGHDAPAIILQRSPVCLAGPVAIPAFFISSYAMNHNRLIALLRKFSGSGRRDYRKSYFFLAVNST
jgi:hypothetical protein